MASVERLLGIVLLFYFVSFVCCHSFRDEDDIIHNVRLEEDRSVSRRSIAQSLRITLVYLDVDKVSNVHVIKQLLNEATEYFRDTLRVKYPVAKVLLQRRCANDSYFLRNETGIGPGKVRYCKVACDAVRPSCGPANVANNDLDLCRVCDENGQDCRPADGQVSNPGAGYTNTDFVLYVTASRDKCDKSKTVAYAAVCQQEMEVDRPIAGFLNICPDKVVNKTIQNDKHELLATLKHEIFHALGFSPSLYAFYRNLTGAPLTKRLGNGMPEYDSQLKLYKWNDKIIKKITRSNWKVRQGNNGEVNHTVHIIVTPCVRDEARKHFNCSTLEGAELENQGGPGTELAHWEKRLFENEGMTGALTQNTVFSRITIALMEDTGWYQVDYRKADPLQWGKNLGCVFATNSCRAWMSAQKKAKNSTEPFCSRLRYPDQGLHTGCSVDMSSVAMCNLVKFAQPLPIEYQYFESLPGILNPENYGGSVDYADFCPYFQAFTWTKQGTGVRGSSCTLSSNRKPVDKNYALEQYGTSSKCFTQGQRWSKTRCNIRWLTSDWGSGCYNYICGNDGVQVIVQGYKFKCFHKGQVIKIKVQSFDGWIHKGSIVCPSCKELCYDKPVPCPEEIHPPPSSYTPPKPKLDPVPCLGNRSHLWNSCFYLFIILQVIFVPF